MTERKRWPNAAEWAREDSLALAQRGLQKSRTLQEHKDVLVVQTSWQIYEIFSLIITALGAVGPGQKTGSSCGQQEPVIER